MIDDDGRGHQLWEKLEAEVERLKIEATIKYEQSLVGSDSLHRDASLVQDGQRTAYQQSLDLIRSAKKCYERACI